MLAAFPTLGVPASARQILPLCDSGHGCPWYYRFGKGADMADYDLTAREDRFIGICLAALAIVVVFAFILSIS
jgi:hypothetical protein